MNLCLRHRPAAPTDVDFHRKGCLVASNLTWSDIERPHQSVHPISVSDFFSLPRRSVGTPVHGLISVMDELKRNAIIRTFVYVDPSLTDARARDYKSASD